MIGERSWFGDARRRRRRSGPLHASTTGLETGTFQSSQHPCGERVWKLCAGVAAVDVADQIFLPSRIAIASSRGLFGQLYDVLNIDVGQLPLGARRLHVDGLAEHLGKRSGGVGRGSLGVPGWPVDRTGCLEKIHGRSG